METGEKSDLIDSICQYVRPYVRTSACVVVALMNCQGGRVALKEDRH
jgi:phage tail protein X